MSFTHAVELFIDDDWVDVTRLDDDTRVLGGDEGQTAITISRGRQDESSDPVPTRTALAMLDKNSYLNGENPLSPYYGKLGLGTQLRIVQTPEVSVTDTFTGRTSTTSWGTFPNVGEWKEIYGGGTISATDFNVASGTAKHSQPAANTARWSYIDSIRSSKLEIYAEVTHAAPTGASSQVGVIVGAKNQGTFYLLMAFIAPTTSAVTVAVYSRDSTNGYLLIDSSAASFTFNAANPIKIRGQQDGNSLYIKMWQGGSEPVSWDIDTESMAITPGGWGGLYSATTTGNTNVKPYVFTWDNVTYTYLNIFSTTEISSLQPSWTKSADGSDIVTVEIEGSGILQRLSEGQKPLRSVAYRALTSPDNAATTLQYLPLEEEADATNIYNTAGIRSFLVSATSEFGAYTEHPATDRMLVFGPDDRLYVTIPTYVAGSTTEFKVACLWKWPSGLAAADERQLFRLYTNGGSFDYVDFCLDTNGAFNVALKGWKNGSIIETLTGNMDISYFDTPLLVTLEFNNAGADAGVLIYLAQASTTTNILGTATWATRNFGNFTSCTVGDRRVFENPDIDGFALGHLIFGNDSDAFLNFTNSQSSGALAGFQGYKAELATARMERLSEEEGIPYSLVGQLADSQRMGLQATDTYLNLMKECVDLDLGMLYEPRDVLGLRYRTLMDMYSEAAKVTLDYADDDLSPPFRSEDDGSSLANDVTVSRPGGSTARYAIPDDDLEHYSSQAPPAGRNAREISLEVNAYLDSQLERIAQWIAHVRAWREQRFKQIKIQLERVNFTSDPEKAQRVASLDLGDVFAVDTTGAPGWVSNNPLKVRILGTNEELGIFQREINFNTSSGRPFDVAIIGYADGIGLSDGNEDLQGQRIDTDSCTLNEDLDTTETAIEVALSGGLPFTTSSTDWSSSLNGGALFIKVNGEVMQVTGVSGASSPFTLTVTRSYNGIVRGHSTGDNVYMETPARIGL